jgi:hypothetical protein
MMRHYAPLKSRFAALAGIVVGVVLTALGVAAGFLVLVVSIWRAMG